jgi:hypothetical protein
MTMKRRLHRTSRVPLRWTPSQGGRPVTRELFQRKRRLSKRRAQESGQPPARGWAERVRDLFRLSLLKSQRTSEQAQCVCACSPVPLDWCQLKLEFWDCESPFYFISRLVSIINLREPRQVKSLYQILLVDRSTLGHRKTGNGVRTRAAWITAVPATRIIRIAVLIVVVSVPIAVRTISAVTTQRG